MRVLAVWLLLVVAGLAPASAQQSNSASDRAFALLGTWSCESFIHSHGTWTYLRAPDGKISMRNRFKTATGLSREFDESYSLDPVSGRWTWTGTQPDRPGFVETGISGPWTAETWNFQGRTDIVTLAPAGSIQPPNHFTQQLRMVYTTLSPDAFRRELEVLQNGRWVSTNGSTCKRTNEPPSA